MSDRGKISAKQLAYGPITYTTYHARYNVTVGADDRIYHVWLSCYPEREHRLDFQVRVETEIDGDPGVTGEITTRYGLGADIQEHVIASFKRVHRAEIFRARDAEREELMKR